MTVKSTVLTKANFDISSLVGKKIIGRIQSGNPNQSLPMHDAYINVYQKVDAPIGTPGTNLLTDIGFYEETVGRNINLGVEHFNAIPDDFKNVNVVVNYAGEPGIPSPENMDFGFALVSFVNLDSAIKGIQVIPTESITQLTEAKTLFFAVTYRCEPGSEHYHVVWAKLTLDPHADPTTWVQVMWYLENQ